MELRNCDIVVVGSGAAGLRAAIEARRQGARTMLLTKGAAAFTGATGSANYSYCAPVLEPDNPELFADDAQSGASDLARPDLLRALAQHAVQGGLDLEAFGVPWDRTSGGAYAMGALPGHTVPRALHVGKRIGKHVVDALLNTAMRVGTEIVEFAFARDLLVADGRVGGVLCLNLATGDPFIVRAGAVILATGGAGQLFRLNTNPNDLTGDGVALAYRAGAQFIDMEFYQFYPTVLVHPHGAYGVELPTGQLIPNGARLTNASGEPFFEHRARVSAREATRDVLARTIAMEIAAGHGTPAGGVFLDATHLPHAEVLDSHVKYLASIGVDVVRSPQQVAPGAHFMMGGIRIDARCRTNVDGLFAAGEVAGGVHGANRLAGNALPDTQVFGTIAGREAAAVARHSGRPPSVDQNWARDRARVARLALRGGHGPSPIDLRKKLQAMMSREAGVLRNRSSMERAWSALDGLEAEAQLTATRSPDPRYNLEWLESMELPNLILTARLLVTAALAREETRGAHNRLDYPDSSADWLRHLVLQRGTDGIDCRMAGAVREHA